MEEALEKVVSSGREMRVGNFLVSPSSAFERARYEAWRRRALAEWEASRPKELWKPSARPPREMPENIADRHRREAAGGAFERPSSSSSPERRRREANFRPPPGDYWRPPIKEEESPSPPEGEDNFECIVCFDAPPTVIFAPCHCCVVCEKCWSRLVVEKMNERCLYCRQIVAWSE